MHSHYHFLLLAISALVAFAYWIFHPTQKAKFKLADDLKNLKTHTVNMLNSVLKTDMTKMVDFHLPDVHCDGMVDRIMSPDELVNTFHTDPALYNKLVACGYTRTVGLLHGFALWSSMSKSRDSKSFKYFADCVNRIDWKNPVLFVNFHSASSIIGKCVL